MTDQGQTAQSVSLGEIGRFVSQNYQAASMTEAKRRGSRSKTKFSAAQLYEELKNTSVATFMNSVTPASVIDMLEQWLTDDWDRLQNLEYEPTTLHPKAAEIFGGYKCYIDRTIKKVFRRTSTVAQSYQLLGDASAEAMFTNYQSTSRYTADFFLYETHPDQFYSPNELASLGGRVPSYKKWFTGQFNAWDLMVEQNMIKEPEYLTTNPNEVAFNYVDLSKITPGPCPTWTEEWEARIPQDFIPIYRAWMFSVIDPQNHGRQALWLKSSGYRGLSSLQSALEQALGIDLIGAVSKDAVSSAFFFSSVYGKRLIVYGDVTNPRLISTEKIHSLLGRDLVQIERKFENAFVGRIYAKLLISGNIQPDIDIDQRHERTRLIFIPLQELPKHVLEKFTLQNGEGEQVMGDETFSKRLANEFWHYMYLCAMSYKKLCPHRSDIMIPSDLQQKMFAQVASESFIELDHFIKEYFEIGSEFSINQRAFNELARQKLTTMGEKFTVSKALGYLNATYGIEPRQTRPKEGPRERVLKGIRQKKAIGIQKHKIEEEE
jgi:hypothetical protein